MASSSVVLGPYVECGHPYGCGCIYWYGCCEACPLPECAKTGIPGGSFRAAQVAPRNAAIAAARAGGVPVADIAQDFHLGKRTVFKVLAQAGSAAALPGGKAGVA